MTEEAQAPERRGAAHILRASFVTEESVYGVILVSGMIVVAGGHGDSS